MSKVIIKGIKEDGKIDAERKSTAILVTELIERLPKMCEADMVKALEEIRTSAERDTRVRQMYAHIIKERNSEKKAMADNVTKMYKVLAGDKLEIKVGVEEE